MTGGSALGSSGVPLVEAHDLVALDLDGVVYVGGAAVPHAAEALSAVRDAGVQLAFVTNNAARTPETVAEHLTDLGVDCEPGDVVTSAQAAARMLRAEVGAHARVFVVGGAGLLQALEQQELVAVTSIDDDPHAVVSGYAPDLPWERVRDGAILVRGGLPWIATNTDATVPTPHGMGPGNGVLVSVLADFSGRSPRVAGKPERALLDETVQRVGGDRPLMVGDRIETDIDGATSAGMPALLVLTGVTEVEQLVSAPEGSRPAYVGADLRALLHPQPVVEVEAGSAVCDGFAARVERGRLVLEEPREDAPEDEVVRGVGTLRAAVHAAWAHVDGGGSAPEMGSLREHLGL